jgi:hypothetical protein
VSPPWVFACCYSFFRRAAKCHAGLLLDAWHGVVATAQARASAEMHCIVRGDRSGEMKKAASAAAPVAVRAGPARQAALDGHHGRRHSGVRRYGDRGSHHRFLPSRTPESHQVGVTASIPEAGTRRHERRHDAGGAKPASGGSSTRAGGSGRCHPGAQRAVRCRLLLDSVGKPKWRNGRRDGLKNRGTARFVWVRLPPSAPN